jgi:DNA-directed RNA polymerase beta' subunit
MFSLIQFAKNVIWIWFANKIYFYVLLQYKVMHLVLMSISDSNVITLKIWIKSSSNQETETNKIKYTKLILKAFTYQNFNFIS